MSWLFAMELIPLRAHSLLGVRPRSAKRRYESHASPKGKHQPPKELRGRRDELFQRIRHQFTFIYRAEGQAIYDQYEEAKRAVDRKIKARERELMNQIQKEYDAVAPVQDMRAQLEGDPESLRPILSTSGRVRYAFMERSRIAKAFFNPPSTRGAEGDMD